HLAFVIRNEPSEAAMLLRIEHETRLSYSSPVSETVFEVRMAPPSDEDQTSLSYRLKTTPEAPLTSYRDGFGNRVDLFNLATAYRERPIQAPGHVRPHRRPGPERLAGIEWAEATRSSIEMAEFLAPSTRVNHSEALDTFVAGLPAPSGPMVEMLRR